MKSKYLDYDMFEGQVERKAQRIKDDPDISKRNKELILRYIREAQIGKTIKKGQKKKVGDGRILQATGYLVLMSKEWFKKDLDKVTNKDMEDFILKLDQGKITTVRNGAGRPYSSETKSNIKKFIRKFYKWLKGDGYTYPALVDWIDTSKQEAQIQGVPGLKEGVWKIVELIPDLRRKAMVWVAFDSGFRLGELVNVTLSDVEKGKDGTYYITCNHSKTTRRTVSLPYSSELLDRWLKEHPLKNDRNAQLWQTTRQWFYETLKIYGKKALNIHVHPHMLRHTSATFYAPKLDRTTFCKRFGWAYSSDMPDRYIDFAKVTENKVVDIVKADQFQELKKALEEERVRRVAVEERLVEMDKDSKAFQEKLLKRFEKKLNAISK
jgi:integrase